MEPDYFRFNYFPRPEYKVELIETSLFNYFAQEKNLYCPAMNLINEFSYIKDSSWVIFIERFAKFLSLKSST